MTNIDLRTIAFIIGKGAIIVFMLIHIFAILILIRQAGLASKVVETGGNSRVLLFSYLHAILLVIILLAIIILPFI